MPVDLGLPAAGAPLPGDDVWQGLGTRFGLSVSTLGLACCAVESVVAGLTSAEPAGDDSSRGHVLVVSGTVTSKLAGVVRAAYDEAPRPTYVMAFGVCASTGGPYWDSYGVVAGVDQVVPVDVYVPGCPPRPEAFVDGLAELGRLIGARA